MSTICFTPASPDIAGMGVRLAVYLQSIICFLPILWAIRDGIAIAEWNLRSIEALATPNLLLGFGILISSIVQIPAQGVSGYDTALALRMGWITSINAAAILLLYAWCKARGSRLGLGARDAKKTTVKKIFTPPTLFVLYSLHLSCIAFLALWTRIGQKPVEASGSQCAMQTVPSIFGAGMQMFGSNALHILSLATYGLSLIPGVNLLPIGAFLKAFVWHPKGITAGISATPLASYAWRGLILAFGVLATINIVLLIDNEFAVWQYGQATGGGGGVGEAFVFGQIVAVMTVFMNTGPFFTLLHERLEYLEQAEESTTADQYLEAKDGFVVPAVTSAVKVGS
ncbi:hypothetical protein NMY22_g16289 [Coprinellus aureogranulatus]|nr:hypothetical protein NMY22_g16289 [Coprinellus aureogranulatus]